MSVAHSSCKDFTASALAGAALLIAGACGSDGGEDGARCEPTPEVCDGVDNDCDGEIDEGLDCCPGEMASVSEHVCIDRWEASRPDATASSAGQDDSIATSRPGVLPWTTGGSAAGHAVALGACQATGKRLCTSDEWLTACEGPEQNVYSYGDSYDPTACNGIDAHCAIPKTGCGAADLALGIVHFRLEPTGAFPRCTNAVGVYDITGNLWEFVDTGGSALRVRGGAFNCGDSQYLHRCSYLSPAEIRAETGFRCCRDRAP